MLAHFRYVPNVCVKLHVAQEKISKTVLRRTFGLKDRESTGNTKKTYKTNFMIYISDEVLLENKTYVNCASVCVSAAAKLFYVFLVCLLRYFDS